MKNGIEKLPVSFANICNYSPCAIYIIGFDGVIQEVNEYFAELCGFSKDEMIGKSIKEINLFFVKNEHQQLLELLSEQQSIKDREISLRHKNGSQRSILCYVETIKHQGNPSIFAMGHDNTPYKNAEISIEKVESTLRALHAINSSHNLHFDKKMGILLELGCMKFQQSTGVLTQIDNEHADAVYIHSTDSTFPLSDRPLLENIYCRETIKYQDPFYVDHVAGTEWEKHPAYLTYQTASYIGIRIMLNNNVFGTLCFFGKKPRTIPFSSTEYEIIRLMGQWVEAEIQRTYNETANLQNMEATEEQIRNKIARDIHDGFGQTLSAIKLNLEALKDNILHKRNTAEQIENLFNLTSDSVSEIKRICSNLSPPYLAKYGLTKAIENLCNINNQNSTLSIVFENKNNSRRYPQHIEMGLFRIAQELLTNAIKHSNASKISIGLRKSRKNIILYVQDNGIGFDYFETQQSTSGRGMKSIITRTNILKGSYTINSQKEAGTFISVSIPLN